MAALKVGDKLPEAILPDQDGQPRRLSELVASGPIVLYFYPRDETAGCTIEACTFRDEYEAFTDAGAQVVGVSQDSVASHKAFIGNHRLPFTLLADTDGALARACGVRAGLGLSILRGRVTYVVDTRGTVRLAFDSKLSFKGHVHKALEMVQALEREARATM
jgi:peroxiredoxin Q/BCP